MARILIIDDDDQVRALLRRILEASFTDVDVNVVGSAAFFVAAGPRLGP